VKDGRDWLFVSTEKVTTIAGSTDVTPPPPRHVHDYVAIQKRFIELRAQYGRHAVAKLLDELGPDGPSREWVYTSFREWSSQTDKK
jgi:hypothetical protein